jgi:hypothetical protein
VVGDVVGQFLIPVSEGRGRKFTNVDRCHWLLPLR